MIRFTVHFFFYQVCIIIDLILILLVLNRVPLTLAVLHVLLNKPSVPKPNLDAYLFQTISIHPVSRGEHFSIYPLCVTMGGNSQ